MVEIYKGKISGSPKLVEIKLMAATFQEAEDEVPTKSKR